jgi:hypothetical protein
MRFDLAVQRNIACPTRTMRGSSRTTPSETAAALYLGILQGKADMSGVEADSTPAAAKAKFGAAETLLFCV